MEKIIFGDLNGNRYEYEDNVSFNKDVESGKLDPNLKIKSIIIGQTFLFFSDLLGHTATARDLKILLSGTP